MLHKKYLLPFVLLFLISGNLHAQVPVIQEPHHKPVLVNDYVRLLDVHINANDTTLYHVHATPSVIVILSNSNIGMQKMGEPASSPNNVTAGATSFVDYGTNPITHRVFNAGNNIFHVMDIEIVPRQVSADSFNILQLPNMQTIVNEKSVKTYKFDVNAHQTLHIDKSNCARLLICVTGEISASNKTIKAGEYIFFEPAKEMSLTNQQNYLANCVLLELK